MLQKCFGTLPPDLCQHNPVSELYGQFLQPHVLVFALTCTVNCGTLYRQVCARLSKSCPINLIYHGWTAIKKINGNRMHLNVYLKSDRCVLRFFHCQSKSGFHLDSPGQSHGKRLTFCTLSVYLTWIWTHTDKNSTTSNFLLPKVLQPTLQTNSLAIISSPLHSDTVPITSELVSSHTANK